MLVSILISTFTISLISFIGMVILFIKQSLLKKILLILVAFSAGALMGGAFLHLLPETVSKSTRIEMFAWILCGFIIFFLIEKILQWHHSHKAIHFHTIGYINLIGDVVHNFIDGLIIAASFITDFSLGVATSLAVAAHEIPQEIGDLGVLLYSGFNKNKALILNFIVALAVVGGGFIGYFVHAYIQKSLFLLLPLAIGGFIYISASDLIPEIREEVELKKSLLIFTIFLIGILIMWLLKIVF